MAIMAKSGDKTKAIAVSEGTTRNEVQLRPEEMWGGSGDGYNLRVTDAKGRLHYDVAHAGWTRREGTAAEKRALRESNELQRQGRAERPGLRFHA
jgi:hypothetical protein